LRSTPDGPRLAWQPVKELKALRDSPHFMEAKTMRVGETLALANRTAGVLEIRSEFEPGVDSEVRFNVLGVPITYDSRSQEISVNGHRARAPLREGRQRIVIYTDRTAFEVFASDGLTYVPMPVIPKTENRAAEITISGSPVKFHALDVYELKSIWNRALKR
jgi:sucrose-6-phosphate hydrolase SacC (GH32 family)